MDPTHALVVPESPIQRSQQDMETDGDNANGATNQQRQQSEINKRMRQDGDIPDGAGPSGATNNSNSVYLESRSRAMQQLQQAATAKVQPAVSAFVKRQQQFNKAEHDHTWMQQHQEAGKYPAFVRDCAPMIKPFTTVDGFDQNAAYQTAVSKLDAARKAYQDAVLAALIECKAAEKQQALDLKSAAQVEAQGILQQPFKDMPANWIDKPEVQRIIREQQEDYAYNCAAAMRNVDKKVKHQARKQAKRQATAAADETEAGPVSVEQQVQQAAERVLKQQQQQHNEQLKQMHQQLTAMQKQVQAIGHKPATANTSAATGSTPAAATRAATAVNPPATTTGRNGGSYRSRNNRGRSNSRGRSSSRGRSHTPPPPPPPRGSSGTGRTSSVTWADVTKSSGNRQQSNRTSTRPATTARRHASA